jgi:hypothetical protein
MPKPSPKLGARRHCWRSKSASLCDCGGTFDLAAELRALDLIDKALAVTLFAQLVTSERLAPFLSLFLGGPEKLFDPLIQNFIFGPRSLSYAGILPHLLFISQESGWGDFLLRCRQSICTLQSEICN